MDGDGDGDGRANGHGPGDVSDLESALDAPLTPDPDGGEGGPPDLRAARRHVLVELLRFVAELRETGVDVPATGTLDAARALARVGLSDRDRVRDATRATLVTAATDLPAFEEAFPPFWRRLRGGIDAVATGHDGADRGSDRAEGPEPAGGEDPATAPAEPAERADAEADPEGFEGSDGEADADPEILLRTGRRHATGARSSDGDGDAARRYSAAGESEPVDVAAATLSPGERGAVERFVDALSTRPGRRTRPARGGDRVDARRALRGSLATGGVPVELPAREPVDTELRCCLLVDVSGSVLDTVDRRLLLAVAEAIAARARGGRVFLFDTELADATDAFADTAPDADPAAALREAQIRWGGGTQIGHAFERLRREHPDAVDRRTAVVVVSDGLDVGEPDALARGVTWLADRAASLVWLNPLAVSPAYEPRARGMATCARYVDALFGFAEPADLAEAARQLERRGLGGPVGHEHDARHLDARAGGENA